MLSGYVAGTSGAAYGNGAILQLPPGDDDSSDIAVGLNNTSDGVKSGSVTLGFSSGGDNLITDGSFEDSGSFVGDGNELDGGAAGLHHHAGLDGDGRQSADLGRARWCVRYHGRGWPVLSRPDGLCRQPAIQRREPDHRHDGGRSVPAFVRARLVLQLRAAGFDHRDGGQHVGDVHQHRDRQRQLAARNAGLHRHRSQPRPSRWPAAAAVPISAWTMSASRRLARHRLSRSTRRPLPSPARSTTTAPPRSRCRAQSICMSAMMAAARPKR